MITYYNRTRMTAVPNGAARHAPSVEAKACCNPLRPWR